MRGGRRRDAVQALLDGAPHCLGIGTRYDLQVEGAHLARLARLLLRLFQRGDDARILEGMARFVNPHHAVPPSLEDERFADRGIQCLRCAFAHEERRVRSRGGLRGQGVTLHQMETGQRKAAGTIAVERQVGNLLGADEGVNHRGDRLHPRHRGQIVLQLCAQGAEGQVHRAVLIDDEIGPAAHRRVAFHQPGGEALEDDDGHHADGDTDDGQPSARTPMAQVLESKRQQTKGEQEVGHGVPFNSAS